MFSKLYEYFLQDLGVGKGEQNNGECCPSYVNYNN